MKSDKLKINPKRYLAFLLFCFCAAKKAEGQESTNQKK